MLNISRKRRGGYYSHCFYPDATGLTSPWTDGYYDYKKL